MKILLASSEAVPFIKTGGLADVVGALAQVLSAKNEVLLILPFYRRIRDQFPQIQPLDIKIKIPMGSDFSWIRVWESSGADNLRVLFVDSVVFDRGGVYGDTPSDGYHDNDFRYALFSRAVLEVAKAVSFQPDVVHSHDWQTGLVSAYLKYIYSHDSFFKTATSIFTIHNMAYQGCFSSSSFALLGLPPQAFQPTELEFYGQISFLKAGLVYSQGLTTVSPTYAKEIQQDAHFGCGMEGVLQERTRDFVGILNGLDVSVWNPLADDHIREKYSKTSLARRMLCKADLQRGAGLPVDANVPLFGFIARLDYQKGVDLLIESVQGALNQGAQLVSLGQGNPYYLDGLKWLVSRYPKQVYHETAFAETLAHKIYSGADIFLMPSRYEPCGLSQMIAMRYGALPVVTPTGGLLDTVDPFPDNKSTGFVASDVSPQAFAKSIDEAVHLFHKKSSWTAMQKRAMSKDFSWKNSSKSYLSFYERFHS